MEESHLKGSETLLVILCALLVWLSVPAVILSDTPAEPAGEIQEGGSRAKI